MSNFDIIRAWKDEQYRLSLSSEEQALLPTNPAGSIELTDDLLDQVAGGDDASTNASLTAGCCPLSVLQSCYWTPCIGSIIAASACIQCAILG